MRRIIPLILLSFILASTLEAQVYKFTDNPQKFSSEIKTFFKDIKYDKTIDIVNNMTTMLESGAFTEDEFKRIYAMSSYMLEKKHYKPLPQFQQYFELLVIYKKKNLDYQKFLEWHKALRGMMDDSKKGFDDLNDAMLPLFSENAIYTSGSKSWYLNTLNYSIGYEKGIPFIKPEGELTLTCLTKNDTLAIYQTTGTYYIKDQKWIGFGGRVDWRRVFLDTSAVFALIKYYSVDMTKPGYVADSVTFTNSRYFSHPLFGRLTDRATSVGSNEKANFPLFQSYYAVYILDKLSKNVTYSGGFTQEGREMRGTSSMEGYGPVTKARVTFMYKGQLTLKAESDGFVITPEKIVSQNAMVIIYFEKDSFFHPKIIFNYAIPNRKLTLTRGDVGLYRSPMYDTYHNLELEFDQMEWNIDNALIDFRMFFGSEASAIFTSKDFFTMGKYLQSQSVLDYHPIDKLKDIAVRMKTRDITIDDYARAVDVAPQYCEALLIKLAADGFITYDPASRKINIRDKAVLYANAAANKTDYDLIKLESTIKKTNAVFSLNTGNLDLEGVGMIMLSDTHRVFVFPKEQQLTVKKNRNFEFNGYVRAGLFEFFGNKFHFDYDNFKIDLANIDSVRIFVKLDPKNKPTEIAKITSVIQNVSGFLYIDHQKNKSGRINYSRYPVFECTKNSYVFYDYPYILGGTYDRDRFYFMIKPFTVDSLDKFTIEGLQFDGTFFSGDILPVFDYKLVPQPDLSLGFTKVDKYPLFVGKGKEIGEGDLSINLSNKGLRGKGSIEYLTSVTTSDDFIFFFDSTRSFSKTFDIEHNARGLYPKVIGRDVFTRWFPYHDTMIIEKINTPFLVFEKQLEFHGNFVLTPKELTSKGQFNYRTAKIFSEHFLFKPNNLLSDDATVNIESKDPGVNAFIAPRIKMDLDVAKDILNGVTTIPNFRISMPVNKYETTMKKFIWYGFDEKVELMKSDDQSEKSCWFISTHSDQDSLKFQSTFASFSLKENVLRTEKVPYIAVADAFVYPDKGEVTIDPDAKMRTLENTVVKADTVKFFHTIYDAVVNVFGKYKMSGYGKYDYIDKYKKKQIINVNNIRVDEAKRAFASGNIPDTPYFFLSPQFKFTGVAKMNSIIKPLDFDGFVIPVHDNPKLRTGWFSFHNRIDPDTVRFSIKQPKGKEGRELFTGIFIGADSPYVYNLFSGYRKSPTGDHRVFAVTEGVLYYDDTTQLFRYGRYNRLFKNDIGGNYLAYNPKTNNIYAEGEFDFGSDIKTIDIRSAGIVNFNNETGRYFFNVMMYIDFPFDQKAINKMSDKVIEVAYIRKETKDKEDYVKIALSELISVPKERIQALSNLEEFGQIVPPKSLQKTIVFTQMKLTYDVNSKFFRTAEERIGLSNIQKNEIRKEVRGGLQLTKKRSGTHLEFYFEPDNETYYYFKYNYGTFSIISSDKDFNDLVLASANKYSQPKYRIKLATARDLDLFKKQAKLY